MSSNSESTSLYVHGNVAMPCETEMIKQTLVTAALSLTAVMEPPMFGVMEPQTGS
jgi:hypothetical protein